MTAYRRAFGALLVAGSVAAGLGSSAAEPRKRLAYPASPSRRGLEPAQAQRPELRPIGDSNRISARRGNSVAVTEATSAADDAVRAAGRAVYFRAGFEEGLEDAREQAHLGSVLRAEGERFGLTNGEARTLGAEIGAGEGASRAVIEAERRVIEQFRDLSSTPRHLAPPAVPSYAPELPEVEEPTLEALLLEFPAPAFGAGGAEEAAWLASPTVPAWSDPRAAFERWLADVERSASYRALAGESERLAFADAFVATFAARIDARRASDLLPAFETGVARGFDYGRFLRAEHEFRSGFRTGWLAAAALAARDAFDRVWAERYAERYASAFDEWSTEPKLEIGEVALDESNQDGVFEPGEPVTVAFRLVNYGGGLGRSSLELAGPLLAASSRIPVVVAPRSILAREGALAARIAERAPLHADTRVELRLGSASRELPLRVSRPLELVPDAWQLERHDLEGRVALRIALRNASRLPVAGRIELSTASRPGFVVERDLGTLRGGEMRRVELAVAELDPLDLLGGRVALDVDVLSAGGVLQDQRTSRVPDAARDLRNRDLVLYAVRLANERTADAHVVAAARSLLFTRLREDWNAAASGVGNPYRFDYRNRTATTALGDLVLTCAALDPASRGHGMFAGLADEVLELSAGLPGTHPFLRSWVRKLARELP